LRQEKWEGGNDGAAHVKIVDERLTD